MFNGGRSGCRWENDKVALHDSLIPLLGSGADPEQQHLLLLSVSGVAAGLQNTG